MATALKTNLLIPNSFFWKAATGNHSSLHAAQFLKRSFQVAFSFSSPRKISNIPDLGISSFNTGNIASSKGEKSIFPFQIRNFTSETVNVKTNLDSVSSPSAAVHHDLSHSSMFPMISEKEDRETRILITGSLGQIGTELTRILRKRYGRMNVLASDVRKPPSLEFLKQGPYVYLDVLDSGELNRIVVDYNIDCVIHLSSILSASGEKDPQRAIELNVNGIQNILEVARKHGLKVYSPSSIAAFGTTTPRVQTPDITIQRPNTIYGVSKVYLELLGCYYQEKYGVDFRSLRYPGVISSETLPGGGTTDYSVEIFYEALKHGKYTCFLEKDTELPMMYMPDCLKATQTLLEANPKSLTQRVYNVTAFTLTPHILAQQIKKYMPNFVIEYRPDFRQNIANSWPKSLNDSLARKDWGWSPDYDLDAMTIDMLLKLRDKLKYHDPSIPLQALTNINLQM